MSGKAEILSDDGGVNLEEESSDHVIRTDSFLRVVLKVLIYSCKTGLLIIYLLPQFCPVLMILVLQLAPVNPDNGVAEQRTGTVGRCRMQAGNSAQWAVPIG